MERFVLSIEELLRARRDDERAPVVNAVAVRSSNLTESQHSEISYLLNLKDIRESCWVDSLVPNQILEPVEICRILLLVSD